MSLRFKALFFACLLSFFVPAQNAHAESNADYTHTPIFMSNSVTPNVMILLDNSGSMNDLAYASAYDTATTYYGYFSSSLTYSYASSTFIIDGSGAWSGNFLNWATMRRVDIARKVLVGGKATSRTGGGSTTNVGDSGSGWYVEKSGSNSDASTLAPFVGSKYNYILYNGYLYIVDTDANSLVGVYTIEVAKDSAQEPDDFLNGNLAGIMQKVSTQARWGLAFFNSTGQGSSEGGSSDDGAYVSQHITGTGYGTNFISDIENTAATNWTPLAESLYQISGYYAQSTGIRYQSSNYSTGLQGNDPFYFSSYSGYISCSKNFVIIITDGAATMYSNIPSTAPIGTGNLQDYDGDGDSTPSSPYYQSDYLDDVALWAHTTDLRSDLSNNQTLTIYAVYAFGNDPTAETLLKDTAKNGGFIDTDDSGTPNITGEWDADGDGIPDTYYQASDGASLETQLTTAITDILKRTSSGTALSVLGTSASGAGNVYQAYFLPSETVVSAGGTSDIEWLGHLMSLSVDSFGSLRDKNNNCMGFTFDTNTNQTNIQIFSESASLCTTTVTSEMSLSSWADYNWDAGESLATRAWDSRNVYGFRDANENGTPDIGELDTLGTLFNYWKYLGAADYNEAVDVVNFVRGEVRTGLRDRTDANGNEWKLGDIIHSTPTVLSKPMEAYDLLYQDTTYAEYLAKHKNRDTMIYIGANDGQIHAFTGSAGFEMWSLVPYNLLPHLRWLKETTYSHVYYMDAKAKATDVQTFNCDTDHVGQTSGKCWGTILLAGMSMGGGEISDSGFDVDGDGDAPSSNQRKFTSSFVALDVTDATATSPTVLWEFGHNLDGRFPSLVSGTNELGFTISYPAVAKVGTKWFAIFGSGSKAAYMPDYDGDSTQTSKLFVVDIETGDLAAKFTVADSNSMLFGPIAVDMDFSAANTTVGSADTYNTDAIYIPESYKSGGIYRGRIWRLVTNGDPDPSNWDMRLLFTTNSGEAITSDPASSSDDDGNVWIYFGTGKYASDADKTNTDTQTFYGIKDPCWDPATNGWDTACLSSSSSVTAASYSTESVSNSTSALMDTTNAVVNTSGAVSGVTGGVGAAPTTWSELLTVAKDSDGWFFNFLLSGERSLNKPTIVGGLVLFTSFVPSTDICAFGGTSYFFSVYYKTGTAYKSSTIGTIGSSNDIILRSETTGKAGLASAVAIHSGQGAGAKAYMQLSTGEVNAISFETASDIKSGIISWRDL